MRNILAIVGRPNVGKSTLFNRLTGQRQAIVEETSGVTRDRHYGISDWNGKEFSIIDTGGYVVGSDDIFEEEIRKQVTLALEEADAILLVVDARQGLSALDEDVAKVLRKTQKNVYVAVNKVDSPKNIHDVAEFYQMGLEHIFPISAINGSGTGDMLDAIVEKFEDNVKDLDDDLPRFAVVGRPNVGKSSLINALSGIDRNIVTDIPGTTRDSINTKYNGFGFEFYLVDTAGLRKRMASAKQGVRKYRILLRHALHPSHRKQRCLCFDARRHPRLRSPGFEHFTPHRKKPQGSSIRRQQVGFNRKRLEHTR